MSSNVEPIGPPWRDGKHCRHCHPQCDGRYDPHDGGVYHEVGEAFTWHPEYGCPVCRIVALLRRDADKSEAQVKSLATAMAAAMLRGEPLESLPEYKEAIVIESGVWFLRAAADHIEVGEA